jgi:hypothetical protein
MPEKRKSHVKSGALVMRSIALVIALVAVLIAPAFAQKTEIEAVNAKWVDFFNKGDFAGVASLWPRAKGSPWMWTLAFGHLEDRTPTHDYERRR